jgi:uncharacterized OsmC-like protein
MLIELFAPRGKMEPMKVGLLALACAVGIGLGMTAAPAQIPVN